VPPPEATLRPLPSHQTGLPRLPEPPFQRAVPTTPADRAGALVDCFPAHGIRIVTFEACSGFTHVTARRIAQPPTGDLCHEVSNPCGYPHMCQSARAAFECPNCGHSCFKLFYYQGRFSGCYRCIGVPYASQQRSTENRPRLQAARLRLFLSSLPDNTETPAKPAICPGEYMPASSIACRSSRQASHVAKSRLHGSSVTKYYAHSQRMTQSAMRSTRACTIKSPFRAKPVFESIDLDQNRLLDRKVIITKAGRDRE
jgi:hypothetical protein